MLSGTVCHGRLGEGSLISLSWEAFTKSLQAPGGAALQDVWPGLKSTWLSIPRRGFGEFAACVEAHLRRISRFDGVGTTSGDVGTLLYRLTEDAKQAVLSLERWS